MTSPLLAVENLRVEYDLGRRFLQRARRFTAVNDVSFTIDAGQTFGLVGESGSGKSTIGSTILRMVKPASGSIVFDGVNINTFGKSTPLSYRRDVQVVFQDPLASFDPRWTIGQSIAEAIRCHQNLSTTDTRIKVKNLLEMTGLSGFQANSLPSELSGGQRQRAAIARALSVDPRLIVCDEAVSALDVSTQNQIINLFQTLQDELGLSYLFIAHDLDLVRALSSVVGVMNKGELVEVGPTEKVYQSPSDPYTKQLLDSRLVADPELQAARRTAASVHRN